jgi:acetyl esterase/lipase
MPRLKPEEVVAPAAFAPQSPPASPEARAYAEAVSAATREEAERGFAPLRVAYGPDIQQRLDVYPAPDNGRPVLLFFHGGAWITGYLWWCGFMARAVQQAGAMLVVGTYRLAPTERFPAQLEDVKAALAWVRANIAAHGGDPTRIVLSGHSAGGHLAALAALDNDQRGIIGCFPVSAPLDIRYRDCAPGAPEERVYKFLLARREDDEIASPILYAERARVRFHLMYGERDFERIVDANRRFAQALPPATRTEVPGASHFATHLALRDPGDDWYRQLKNVIGRKR